jgi:hypothetical protein
MVAPSPNDEDRVDPKVFNLDEIRSIRATYSTCGLYRNDGSTTPIWTIPYLDWTHDVYIASDGRHMVIADEDWEFFYSGHEPGHVATFFVDGQLLRSYCVDDLIVNFRLKEWINGRRSTQCDRSAFDADALTYSVRTNQCEEFVFDLTTGNVVRHKSPWPVAMRCVVLGIAIAFACALYNRFGTGRLGRVGQDRGAGAGPPSSITARLTED